MAHDRQYDDMNAGAHRKAAPQIAAPAVTWFRGFWRPAKGSTSTPQIDDKGWYQSVDAVLLSLFRHFRAQISSEFTCPNLTMNEKTLYLLKHKVQMKDSEEFHIADLIDKNSHNTKHRTARHDDFLLSFEMYGAKITISANMHYEYFTLLYSAEFNDEDLLTPHNDVEFIDAGLHLHRLHKIVCERFNSQDPETPIIQHLDGDRKKSADGTRREIIEKFKDWVDATTKDALAMGGTLGASLDECGGLFADFRGIVFSLRLEDDPASDRPKLVSGCPRPKLPSDNYTLTIPARVEGRSFDGHALEVVDAIWPVVRGLQRERQRAVAQERAIEQRFGKPEYTISTFHNGRAIYVSTLGRMLPAEVHAVNDPVIFTLILSYNSGWRGGRLIDRLHSLGTLRLAALRDINQLSQASNLINVLVARLSHEENSRSAQENERDIKDEFSEIGKSIDVGITYRIARSRYYAANFREMLEMMKPGVVEGFSSYDEFVQRKIFDAFYFIDRLGRRYDDLRGQVAFAISAGQQQAMRDLRKVTLDHVSALLDSAKAAESHMPILAAHTAAVSKQTTVTAKLLEVAEKLTILPFTYYAGHIIGDSINSIFEAMELFCSKIHPRVEFWRPAEVLYYVAGFFVALGITRYARTLRERLLPD